MLSGPHVSDFHRAVTNCAPQDRNWYAVYAVFGSPPSTMPAANERGPIAESYDELQAISELQQARSHVPLPAASVDSVNRTALQAAEVALLNIGDILQRSAADIRAGNTAGASRKLAWAAGFHRLLVELSLVPQRAAALECAPPQAVLSIARSRAYRALRVAVRRFDRCVIDTLGPLLEPALADPSAHLREAEIAHLARICSHESEVWERNLLSVPVWHTPRPYSEYIAAPLLRKAACGFALAGDTYFMQFRALHQVPELMAMECCDHLVDAARNIENEAPLDALCRLSCVNSLLHVVAFSIRPMVENLTTADYHTIRANLGLTSGSHSTVIRHKLFHEVYSTTAAAAVARGHFRSPDPASRLLASELLRARSSISLWRDLHVHLSRNNLGGSAPSPTRSLIGSVDALATVRQMQADAARRDPLHDAAAALRIEPQGSPALAAYALSESSLDTCLRQCTARITQRRFPEVQERTGYFSGRPHCIPTRQDI